MNRTIRGLDLNGAQVLHAEEIGPDDWRGVDCERPAGICRYTWQTLVTRVAEMVTGGLVYSLETGAGPGTYPDRAGGLWLNGLYLPPVLWVPSVIPPYPPQR